MEIPGRTNDSETGSDIVEGGSNCRKAGYQILSIKADDEEGDHEDHKVGDEVDIGGTQYVMLNGFAIHFDLFDALGMDIGNDLLDEGLEEDHDPGDFETTTGGTGTGADEHQSDQDHFRYAVPFVEVHRGKTGCCYDAADLEESLSKGTLYISHMAYDPAENGQGGEGNDNEVPADFLHGQRFLRLLMKKEVVEIEVDTEQHTEGTDDPLLGNGIACGAVIPNTETTGSGGTEGHAEGVKERHAGAKEQDDLDQSHADIDEIEDLCGRLDFGNQLSNGRSGRFCLHEVDIRASGQWNDGKKEDQNSHAAGPVGETPPDQGSVGNRLDIGKDTGSCGRETGNCFEKSVKEGGNLSCQHKRKTAEDGHNEPGQSGCDASFFEIKKCIFGLLQTEKGSQDKANQCHNDICIAL